MLRRFFNTDYKWEIVTKMIEHFFDEPLKDKDDVIIDICKMISYLTEDEEFEKKIINQYINKN